MSRRFRGRHARVKADPNAKPAAPVVLNESNSFRDPAQPDCRKPKVLNARRYVAAGVVEEERQRGKKAKAAAAAAP